MNKQSGKKKKKIVNKDVDENYVTHVKCMMCDIYLIHGEHMFFLGVPLMALPAREEETYALCIV